MKNRSTAYFSSLFAVPPLSCEGTLRNWTVATSGMDRDSQRTSNKPSQHFTPTHPPLSLSLSSSRSSLFSSIYSPLLTILTNWREKFTSLPDRRRPCVSLLAQYNPLTRGRTDRSDVIMNTWVNYCTKREKQ